MAIHIEFENEQKRKESSKREKTWENLIQIYDASNKGFELNTESVSDITKEVNKKGENIFENGHKNSEFCFK